MCSMLRLTCMSWMGFCVLCVSTLFREKMASRLMCSSSSLAISNCCPRQAQCNAVLPACRPYKRISKIIICKVARNHLKNLKAWYTESMMNSLKYTKIYVQNLICLVHIDTRGHKNLEGVFWAFFDCIHRKCFSALTMSTINMHGCMQRWKINYRHETIR